MALIKCPECKKEFSNTINKCPHCGYKIKSSVDVRGIINKIVSNKKILFSIIGVLLVVITIYICSFGGVKVQKASKKMVEYLQDIGYSCSQYDEDDSEICFYCFYCTNMTSNGVSQTVQIDYRNNYVGYKESAYDAYEFSISSTDYDTSSTRTQKIFYNDLVENEKFHFNGKARNYFVVGENVNCDDYQYGERKMICPDIINDVNSSMRTFESYFSGAGIELGK